MRRLSNLTQEVQSLPVHKLRKAFHDKLMEMNEYVRNGRINIFDTSTLNKSNG